MDPFFLWKDNGPIAVPCGTSSVGLNWRRDSIAENLGSVEVNGKTLTDFSGARTAPSFLLKIKLSLSPSPIPAVCLLKCERHNSAPKARAEVERLGAGAVSAQRGSLRPQLPQTPPLLLNPVCS